MKENISLYRKKSIFQRTDYLRKTDPSQDEFSVSSLDLSSSFGSDTNSQSVATKALLYVDSDILDDDKVDLKKICCSSNARKLIVMWSIGAILLIILLVIGLTGKYYIADEVSFILMTFIRKFSPF